jgi:hypothetical protein
VIPAPSDQIGRAVETVAQQHDARITGQPGRNGFEKLLLGLETKASLRRFDPPRQRQRPLPAAHRQHQHLRPVGKLGLVHDQGDRLAIRGGLDQNLAGEGFHDRIGAHQVIGEKANNPLVTHVRAIGRTGQPGGQIHEVRTAHVQHGRDQQRQFSPLCLALIGKPLLQFSLDAVRDTFDVVHETDPGSALGGLLESRADSRRQHPLS